MTGVVSIARARLSTLPAWLALVGALALALAGWLAWWATPAWQAETSRAAADLRQRVRALPAMAAAAPPRSRADALLVSALPPPEQLPRRISALLQQAQQQGLQLDSVRQQPALRLGQAAAALDAERVPLRMVGKGPYGAWRQLVAEALQQDDALALAELQLSRSTPADSLLAGTLQWNLLQRRPASGAAEGTP